MRVIPVGPLLDVGALSSASREAYHSLVSVRGDLHSCRQCSYATKNKALMQRHLFKHTGERPFQCHLCPAAFARKTNLKTHIRTHTGERPFSCDCCSASFTRQNTLMEHMLTHTGERPFFCDQCSVSFSQRGSLIRHMRTHTGERPFYCCHCNASFSRKHHLVRHVNSQHTRNWDSVAQLSYVVLFLTNPALLWYNNHEDMLTTWDMFVDALKECFGELATRKKHTISQKAQRLENLSSVADIIKHCDTFEALKMRRIAPKSGRLANVPTVACVDANPPSDLSSTNRQIFRKELLRCHEISHYSSDDCYRGSLSSTSHEQYQSLVTVQGGLHSCRQCTYVTKYKGNMQQHLCRHTGVHPFECHLCSATFSRNYLLMRHIYTHSGKLPFSCDHCRASFAHKGTLVDHVVHTHPGERSFSCDQCSASFSYKYSLVLHMRYHAGERPFSCDQCDASFVTAQLLKSHMYIHRGKRPFSCKLCNASYSQNYRLINHLSHHHANKKP
ncbi:uncharacterized protein LOC119183423 [Rhipicephalus microplus]|uniref:uncharacterized protein LOC119183423 n=1 Tax=Rhipicephalus microplus TaxID=6941 RepID=UPI003F6D68F4